jgi:hypothetical protein
MTAPSEEAQAVAVALPVEDRAQFLTDLRDAVKEDFMACQNDAHHAQHHAEVIMSRIDLFLLPLAVILVMFLGSLHLEGAMSWLVNSVALAPNGIAAGLRLLLHSRW